MASYVKTRHPTYFDLLAQFKVVSKDVYHNASHFLEMKELSHYRNVHPAQLERFHRRLMDFWLYDIPHYTNECFTTITRFCIDIDNYDPFAQLCPDGPTIIQAIQEEIHRLYPHKPTWCVALACGAQQKDSYHLHWPFLFLHVHDAQKLLHHLWHAFGNREDLPVPDHQSDFWIRRLDDIYSSRKLRMYFADKYNEVSQKEDLRPTVQSCIIDHHGRPLRARSLFNAEHYAHPPYQSMFQPEMPDEAPLLSSMPRLHLTHHAALKLTCQRNSGDWQPTQLPECLSSFHFDPVIQRNAHRTHRNTTEEHLFLIESDSNSNGDTHTDADTDTHSATENTISQLMELTNQNQWVPRAACRFQCRQLTVNPSRFECLCVVDGTCFGRGEENNKTNAKKIAANRAAALLLNPSQPRSRRSPGTVFLTSASHAPEPLKAEPMALETHTPSSAALRCTTEVSPIADITMRYSDDPIQDAEMEDEAIFLGEELCADADLPPLPRSNGNTASGGDTDDPLALGSVGVSQMTRFIQYQQRCVWSDQRYCTRKTKLARKKAREQDPYLISGRGSNEKLTYYIDDAHTVDIDSDSHIVAQMYTRLNLLNVQNPSISVKYYPRVGVYVVSAVATEQGQVRCNIRTTNRWQQRAEQEALERICEINPFAAAERMRREPPVQQAFAQVDGTMYITQTAPRTVIARFGPKPLVDWHLAARETFFDVLKHLRGLLSTTQVYIPERPDPHAILAKAAYFEEDIRQATQGNDTRTCIVVNRLLGAMLQLAKALVVGLNTPCALDSLVNDTEETRHLLRTARDLSRTARDSRQATRLARGEFPPLSDLDSPPPPPFTHAQTHPRKHPHDDTSTSQGGQKRPRLGLGLGLDINALDGKENSSSSSEEEIEAAVLESNGTTGNQGPLGGGCGGDGGMSGVCVCDVRDPDEFEEDREDEVLGLYDLDENGASQQSRPMNSSKIRALVNILRRQQGKKVALSLPINAIALPLAHYLHWRGFTDVTTIDPNAEEHMTRDIIRRFNGSDTTEAAPTIILGCLSQLASIPIAADLLIRYDVHPILATMPLIQALQMPPLQILMLPYAHAPACLATHASFIHSSLGRLDDVDLGEETLPPTGNNQGPQSHSHALAAPSSKLSKMDSASAIASTPVFAPTSQVKTETQARAQTRGNVKAEGAYTWEHQPSPAFVNLIGGGGGGPTPLSTSASTSTSSHSLCGLRSASPPPPPSPQTGSIQTPNGTSLLPFAVLTQQFPLDRKQFLIMENKLCYHGNPPRTFPLPAKAKVSNPKGLLVEIYREADLGQPQYTTGPGEHGEGFISTVRVPGRLAQNVYGYGQDTKKKQAEIKAAWSALRVCDFGRSLE